MFTRANSLPAAIVLTAGVLISISCGKKEDAEPAVKAAALTAGVTQNLPRVQGIPSCVIDEIGPVSNPAAQKSVQVSGATAFSITGWAIDEVKKAPAGGVDVVIDMVPYSAHYGSERPDVAAHFSQPGYQASGFELPVAPGQLAKGPHSVSIRVITSDKKAYYQGPMVQFAVN